MFFKIKAGAFAKESPVLGKEPAAARIAAQHPLVSGPSVDPENRLPKGTSPLAAQGTSFDALCSSLELQRIPPETVLSSALTWAGLGNYEENTFGGPLPVLAYGRYGLGKFTARQGVHLN